MFVIVAETVNTCSFLAYIKVCIIYFANMELLPIDASSKNCIFYE